MKRAIGINLSGNNTTYFYSADEADLVNVSVGAKVVIPNKTKDDGSLSLSIGTYRGPATDVAPEGLKPVVQFLDGSRLREVHVAVLKMEAVAGGAA